MPQYRRGRFLSHRPSSCHYYWNRTADFKPIKKLL